ncbi:hypothetical protein BH24ACT5_BH24ACT5_01830 [soil metagenome]
MVTVHPRPTRTEQTTERFQRRAAEFGVSVSEKERLGSKSAIGRLINAFEGSAVVAFLASPVAVAVNGDAGAVGGGQPGAIY